MDLAALFKQVLSLSLMGSVVAVGILLIKAALKKRLSASWHYYLWLVLVLRLLIPFTPATSYSVFNLLPSYRQKVASGQAVVPNSPGTITEPGTTNGPGNPVANGNRQGSLPPAVRGLSFSYETATRVWLFGVLALLFYILMVNGKLAYRLKKQPLCKEPGVGAILEMCKHKLKLQAEVAIISDHSLKSPGLYGLIRPKILLSPEVTGKLAPEELQYVFIHELIHLKRKDLWLNTAVMLLQVIYWFNPIIWYAFNQMKQDIEMACDATALALLKPEEMHRYGQTMINLLQLFSEPYWAPGTLGFANKYSVRRIKMIATFNKTTIKWSILALALTLMVGGCSFLAQSPSGTTGQRNPAQTGSQPANQTAGQTPGSGVSISAPDNADTGSGSSGNASSPQNDQAIALLKNMMQLAQQGRVINSEFAAKTTNFGDIENKLGEPDRTDWVPAAKGTYATYAKNGLAFGFNKGMQIFEVRSFDSRLKKINMAQVKTTFGPPAYEVKANGEVIIGYTAGPEFKILLVFPEPAGKSLAYLDHYSVLYPQGTVNMMADDPGRQW